jgi:hypothetical protein
MKIAHANITLNLHNAKAAYPLIVVHGGVQAIEKIQIAADYQVLIKFERVVVEGMPSSMEDTFNHNFQMFAGKIAS